MWVKLDDGFADHPKLLDLPAELRWRHVQAMCYCGRYLTNGRIPRAFAAQDGPARDALVAAKLWDFDGTDHFIHDWAKYNPTREQVKAEADAAAERKRKWLEEQKKRRDRDEKEVRGAGAGREKNAVQNAVQNASITGDPSSSSSSSSSSEILQTAKAVCASAPPTADAADPKPKKTRKTKSDKAPEEIVPNEVREARAKVREHFKLRWAEASDAQPEAYFWAARQNVSLNERLRHLTNTHRGDVAAAGDSFCVLIDRCYLNRRPAWKWAKGDVPKWESFIESLEELAKAQPEPNTNGNGYHRSANNGGVSPAFERAVLLTREIEEMERAEQRAREGQSGASGEAASPVSVRVLGAP